MGYSSDEIRDAQARQGVRFPSDLIALLREHKVPPGQSQPFTCMDSDIGTIRKWKIWAFRIFWFDVEHNRVWWPEWGVRPEDRSERRLKFRAAFRSAPRLISLHRHRFLPSIPAEAGNPIFSVMGSDTICYGANLQDWLLREQGQFSSLTWPELKSIPFWSDAVRHNDEDGAAWWEKNKAAYNAAKTRLPAQFYSITYRKQNDSTS